MARRRGAVILAGGRSERMGRPKAFLRIEGEPLLARVVSRVQAACELVVVAGSPGEPLPQLPAHVLRVDDPPERAHEGPLSGLAAGLHALADRGIELAYLGAGDAVFVDTAHVRWMLDRLEADSGHTAVVACGDPQPDGRDASGVLHPLCGAVRVAEAVLAIDTLLHAGRRAARALYELLDTRRISVTALPDPRAVRDCDTPQEWADALGELAGR